MIYYDAKDHEDFTIVAATVDKRYLDSDKFIDLPRVDFALIQDLYPAEQYDMLLLYSGPRNLRSRKLLFDRMKEKGYLLRNYVSPKADYAGPRLCGENNVVMAGAHVGLNSRLGDNNLIRQNSYLGHDVQMGSHTIMSPGCCIGSHALVKNNCYIGLNATVRNSLILEKETLVGAGAVVIRNTEEYSENVGNPSRVIGYHKDEGIKMLVRRGLDHKE
jgi:hypothetical protein